MASVDAGWLLFTLEFIGPSQRRQTGSRPQLADVLVGDQTMLPQGG
jgi:hypothetical protein